MKKWIALSLVMMLAFTLFSGCRRKKEEPTTVPTTVSTTAPTTQPTTQPVTRPSTAPTTVPTTSPTNPMESMIPGSEDTLPSYNGAENGTVDPTAGENNYRRKISPRN